ncbi:unnamed protein product [Phaeothamnion confervicola]
MRAVRISLAVTAEGLTQVSIPAMGRAKDVKRETAARRETTAHCKPARRTSNWRKERAGKRVSAEWQSFRPGKPSTGQRHITCMDRVGGRNGEKRGARRSEEGFVERKMKELTADKVVIGHSATMEEAQRRGRYVQMGRPPKRRPAKGFGFPLAVYSPIEIICIQNGGNSKQQSIL